MRNALEEAHPTLDVALTGRLSVPTTQPGYSRQILPGLDRISLKQTDVVGF